MDLFVPYQFLLLGDYYTAVAFLGDVVDFNVRTIAGLTQIMGVPYAKQVFHVEDDAQQIITLNVPGLRSVEHPSGYERFIAYGERQTIAGRCWR